MASNRPSNMDMYHSMMTAAIDTLLLKGYITAFTVDKPLTVKQLTEAGTYEFNVARTYKVTPETANRRGYIEDVLIFELPNRDTYPGLVLKALLTPTFEIERVTIMTVGELDDLEATLAASVHQLMKWLELFTGSYNPDGTSRRKNPSIGAGVPCDQL